jgi:hypothetical protein
MGLGVEHSKHSIITSTAASMAARQAQQQHTLGAVGTDREGVDGVEVVEEAEEGYLVKNEAGVMAARWHRPATAAPNHGQARARPRTSPGKAANTQEWRGIAHRRRSPRIRRRLRASRTHTHGQGRNRRNYADD